MPRKKNGSKNPLIATVIALVATEFGISEEKVTTDKVAKKVAIFLLKFNNVPVPLIQREFNIKFNSSVYVACNWVKKKSDTDGAFGARVRRLLVRVKASVSESSEEPAGTQAVSFGTPSESTRSVSRSAVKTEDDKLVQRICTFVGDIYLHFATSGTPLSFSRDVALYLLTDKVRDEVLYSTLMIGPEVHAASLGRVILAMRDPIVKELIIGREFAVAYVIEPDPK